MLGIIVNIQRDQGVFQLLLLSGIVDLVVK